MSENLSVCHIPAGQGERVEAYGDSVLFKLETSHTGGRLVVGFVTTPPGVGPPLHRHSNEDELFIVVSGTYEFTTEDGKITATTGDVVFAPKGRIHTFKNVGDEPSSAWVIAQPSGFDKFFRASAAEFATGSPDIGRLMEICAAHGIELLGPPPG